MFSFETTQNKCLKFKFVPKQKFYMFTKHEIIINLMLYNYSIQYNLKYKSYLTALTVFYFLRICLLKIIFHYYYYYYLS